MTNHSLWRPWLGVRGAGASLGFDPQFCSATSTPGIASNGLAAACWDRWRPALGGLLARPEVADGDPVKAERERQASAVSNGESPSDS